MLKQLLALPVSRRLAEQEVEKQLAKQRSEDFYDEFKPPSDEAPIEDLVDYWNRRSDYGPSEPSNAVRQRLFEAALADPATLLKLIRYMPNNEIAAAKIKEVYDKAELNDGEREQIKEWLIFNSNFFLDELLDLVRKVKEDEKSGSIENREALVALARVNWELAEPLLRNLLASAQPRSIALAQSLCYENAIRTGDSTAEERYRNSLKAIVANRNLPASARHFAIEALSSSDWSGRDDWYLGLFQDETLLEPTDGDQSFSSPCTIFYSDPNKWVPVMARLMESKDLTVRSTAARCLIELPRRDALLPLLPLLSNRTWIKNRFDTRLALIQSMASVDIPESVPGLIWAVEDDSLSGLDRSFAAQSLARYKDVRAAPVLKKALNREKEETNRTRILEGLIASQGVTDTEQLEALEAYATKLTTPAGRQEVEHYRSTDEEPLPLLLSVGKYLSRLPEAPDSLVHAVLSRAENLKSDNLPLANALIEVAHRWQGRQIDLDMITRIGNGSADANTITEALKRRAPLRQNLSQHLHTLTSLSGIASGIGAVLLENPSLAHDVLISKDQLAQTALLACSRLTNKPLPVELVGPLLRSKNELLALATERYLLLEDSKAARDFLWQHHANKAFVTGWDENSVSGGFNVASKAEEKLRAELFKENGPVEIIALAANDTENHRVLRVFSDKAVYTHYEDVARYRERVVSQADLASFRQFLSAKNFADLGPQFGRCYHNNCSYEVFLTLTKEKGRRVYSEQMFEVWSDLRDKFDLLGEGAKLHYNLETEIKGLEVLFADDELAVRDVCQQGGEIRVFVQRELTDAELEAETESDDEDDSEAARIDRWRRFVALQNLRFSWRVYANNKAGTVTSQPEVYSTIDVSKFPPDRDDYSIFDIEPRAVEKLTDDSIIFTRDETGLWKQLAGTKAVRVSDQGFSYSNPIATPDGKWVVVAKRDGNWTKPSYIVRFNVRTGREFRVNLEATNDFVPMAFVVSQGKVLLRRAKNEYVSSDKAIGPDRPEHYLLDPSTGDTRLVTGEFTPLYEKGKRFLQASEQPNEFWAAIPDDNKKQTQVGRYNVKDFTFKSLLTVPQISFESMSMWVDEREKKLYVVYEGQLLRLPLP